MKETKPTPAGILKDIAGFLLREHKGDFIMKRNHLTPSGPSVYFVSGGSLIKIGHAGDVAQRILSLQRMSPVRLEILGTMPGGKAEEREIHRKFSHLRKHGEWFKREIAILDFIDDNCVENTLLNNLPDWLDNFPHWFGNPSQ